MSLEFHNREVHINAIRIPWDTLPGADKIAKCYGFYKEHGFLDRVIVIDGQYWLRDGLAGLMVARAVGLKRVKVLQVTEKKDKPEAKTDVKPEVKTEDKPETKSTTPPDFRFSGEVEGATKLRVFCVRTLDDGVLSMTRGMVYPFDGGMQYDNALCPNLGLGKSVISFGAWRRDNPGFARCVVPLVNRPAKVGEWVRVLRGVTAAAAVEAGDICQVLALHKWADTRGGESYVGAVYVSSKNPRKYPLGNMDRPISTENFDFLWGAMYEVLEGYDGRFEPAAEEPDSQPGTDQAPRSATLCASYHERRNGPRFGVIGECWGTKEKEGCSCHGYKELCDHYPEVREQACQDGGSHETEV